MGMLAAGALLAGGVAGGGARCTISVAAALSQLTSDPLLFVSVKGLMGMASFSHDRDKIRNEFRKLKTLFDHFSQQPKVNDPWSILSIGMSGDYQMAIEEGSTLVRIGSLIFGERTAA